MGITTADVSNVNFSMAVSKTEVATYIAEATFATKGTLLVTIKTKYKI